MPENSKKNQGFLLKNLAQVKKTADAGNSGYFHSGDPKWAFWDDFPWRMKTAEKILNVYFWGNDVYFWGSNVYFWGSNVYFWGNNIYFWNF